MYRLVLFPGILFLLMILSLRADVKLSALFSNGAVLQRSATVPVFGTAEPGENVAVHIGGVSGRTVTGANGKWLVRLDLSNAGTGPFRMMVEGKNKFALNDILIGEVWLCGGQSNMDFHSSFFPDFTNFDNVVLAASIFLFYAGMEMGGIHVKDVENPSKNYPKAVFIGALITVLIFVLGTFALGVIIPAKDINLTQSLLVGFDNYFKYIHASWLSPIIAIALAFGVLAGVLTWVAGPSKGIFAVGKAGYMPPFFQKTNKLGVQKNILFVQGLAVTVLSLLFVVMPSVQSFYQILSQLTVILYLIMYLLMFSGAIALRYKMKKLNRPFRIGKSGNGLMWFVGGLGFCGSLLAFILSFIPPSQISTGSNTVWFSVLIIGAIIVVVAPFIIYASKKPSWVDPNSNFEPFHWEVQAQPATASPSVTKPSTTASGPSSSNSSAPSSGSSASTSTSLGSGDKDKDTPKS